MYTFSTIRITGACFEVATEFTIVGHPRPTFGCIRLNWRYPRKVEVELGVLWQSVNCTVSARRAARLRNCNLFSPQFVYWNTHRYLARFQSWRNVSRGFIPEIRTGMSVGFFSGAHTDISGGFILEHMQIYPSVSSVHADISSGFILEHMQIYQSVSFVHSVISGGFILDHMQIYPSVSFVHSDISDGFILEHMHIYPSV